MAALSQFRRPDYLGAWSGWWFAAGFMHLIHFLARTKRLLPRRQDKLVLPDRVVNRIRSNFLPRGASRTIYYYRIIKVDCVQIPLPSVMRGGPGGRTQATRSLSKTATKCRSRKRKKALRIINAWETFDLDI